MYRPIRAAALLAAAAVLLTACGEIPGTPTPSDRTATVTTTQPAPPPPTVTVTETPSPAPAPPPQTTTETVTPPPETLPEGEPEGNTDSTAPMPPPQPDTTPQTPDEIRAEVLDAVSVTDTYWQNLFHSWDVKWWTPGLYHTDGFYDSFTEPVPGCHGNFDNEFNAFSCPTGGGTSTLAWDMEFFRLYQNIGDGVYYVTVAHEYGHSAQFRFVADGQGLAVPVSNPGQENQADCIAGATLGKAERDGNLTIEPGDLDEIDRLLIKLSDPTGADHGTAEQRVGLFHLGYGSADIESCLFNKGQPPPGWFGPR